MKTFMKTFMKTMIMFKNTKILRPISLILAILVLFQFTAHVNVQAKDFPDVSRDHWAYDAINTLSNKGIISGDGNGNFRPNDTIAVDEFIKLMVTAMGHNLSVGTDYWATPFINKALQLGLFPDGEFNDYRRPITRLEIARLVSRAMSNEQFPVDIEVHSWQLKDFYEQALWERDYISRVFLKGIVVGLPDGTFGPDRNASRAEAAVMVHRYIDPSKRIPAQDKVPEGIVFKPVTDYQMATIYEWDPTQPGYYWHIDLAAKHFTFFQRSGAPYYYNIENYLPSTDFNPLLTMQISNVMKAMHGSQFAVAAQFHKPIYNPPNLFELILAEDSKSLIWMDDSKYLFTLNLYENSNPYSLFQGTKAKTVIRNLKDVNGNYSSAKLKKLWDCYVALFGYDTGNKIYEYVMLHYYNLNIYLEEVANNALGYFKEWENQINNVTVYTICNSQGLAIFFKY